MAEGWALSAIGKAIIVIVVIIVGVVIFTSLASGSGSKLNDLFASIPGIPEKEAILEAGTVLEGGICYFSYECGAGYACWKGFNGGSSMVSGKCVKSLGAKLLTIQGKAGADNGAGGDCYHNIVQLLNYEGDQKRDNSITLQKGLYVVEATNDKICVGDCSVASKARKVIKPNLFAYAQLRQMFSPDDGETVDSVKTLSEVTLYVLKNTAELRFAGWFQDSDCGDNKGINGVRFDLVSNDPNTAPQVTQPQIGA